MGASPVALDIAACTRQIESGFLSPNDLAITYDARGNAHEHKKQFALRGFIDLGSALRAGWLPKLM